jgi:hypothetical protein
MGMFLNHAVGFFRGVAGCTHRNQWGIAMSRNRVFAPVLNIGKLSEDRYKFSFATTMGTLFSEISVRMNSSILDPRSEEQKMGDALLALRRIAQELEIAIAETPIRNKRPQRTVDQTKVRVGANSKVA